MGYSSLWDFATRFLGLSEGAAQRRISAMRLSEELPEVKAALESGHLSLSNASQIHGFFKRAKNQGREKSNPEKRVIVSEILAVQLPAVIDTANPDNKKAADLPIGISQKKCEQLLADLAPEVKPTAERARPVAPGKVELKITLDSSAMETLKDLKDLLAHQLTHGTYSELITLLANQSHKRVRKGRPEFTQSESVPAETAEQVPSGAAAAIVATQSQAQSQSHRVSPAEIGFPTSQLRKVIPAGVRKHSWNRAQGQCEYSTPAGVRCRSRYRLQLDHRLPLAFGGDNDLDNLQWLCTAHHGFKPPRPLKGLETMIESRPQGFLQHIEAALVATSGIEIQASLGTTLDDLITYRNQIQLTAHRVSLAETVQSLRTFIA
jgi:hypothetical protein